MSNDLLTARDKKMLGIAALAGLAGGFLVAWPVGVAAFVGVVGVNKYIQSKEKK